MIFKNFPKNKFFKEKAILNLRSAEIKLIIIQTQTNQKLLLKNK
jgi:hypothetical protein